LQKMDVTLLLRFELRFSLLEKEDKTLCLFPKKKQYLQALLQDNLHCRFAYQSRRFSALSNSVERVFYSFLLLQFDKNAQYFQWYGGSCILLWFPLVRHLR